MRWLRPGAGLLLGLALAACQPRTEVSATGNAPARYAHVFLTVSQLWFNTNADAGADDSGWSRFTLTAPVTIDLVALGNGALGSIASALKVSPGSYGELRLILADPSSALAASAQAVGARSNDEVDYLDADRVVHQVPLGVPNSAQGIRIGISLTIADADSGGSGIAAVIGPATGAQTELIAAGSAPATSLVVPAASAIVDFDAGRDLVPVSLSGAAGFLLVPHPMACDPAGAGTISGTVNLAGVPVSAVTGLPDVQVTAEGVSGDGSRHTIVQAAQVTAAGSFSLYPLPSTVYDLVIHGPAIDTVVIRSVPVSPGDPGTAAVRLGTITLTAAASMPVNVSAAAPVSPAAASIGFYQTLPLSGEIPYLVEVRNADPFSGVFAADQLLSAGNLQYGTYDSLGIGLTTVAPAEGAATYHVAAFNSPYGDGPMTARVKSAGTTTATFAAAAIPPPAGSVADSVSGTVAVARRGAYDRGELLLTHDGVLVAAAALDAWLGAGSFSSVTLATGIPGGGAGSYAAGLYYAEAWVWNSSDPAGTLSRQPYAGTIDLTAGPATGVSLNIQ